MFPTVYVKKRTTSVLEFISLLMSYDHRRMSCRSLFFVMVQLEVSDCNLHIMYHATGVNGLGWAGCEAILFVVFLP